MFLRVENCLQSKVHTCIDVSLTWSKCKCSSRSRWLWSLCVTCLTSSISLSDDWRRALRFHSLTWRFYVEFAAVVFLMTTVGWTPITITQTTIVTHNNTELHVLHWTYQLSALLLYSAAVDSSVGVTASLFTSLLTSLDKCLILGISETVNLITQWHMLRDPNAHPYYERWIIIITTSWTANKNKTSKASFLANTLRPA